MSAHLKTPSKIALILTVLALVVPSLGDTTIPLASATPDSPGAPEIGAAANEYSWNATPIDGASGSYIVTVPQNGGEPGSFFLVHTNGVSLMHPDGSYAWLHGIHWLVEAAGLSRPYNYVTPMGFDYQNPITITDERNGRSRPTAVGHPIAVGDVSGDGIGDLAVSRYLGHPYYQSLVSVMDGQDGSALWARLFPGVVPYLMIQDGILVVADQTGPTKSTSTLWFNVGGEGTTNAVSAYDVLNDKQIWTIQGAPWATYLAFTAVGTKSIAYAWTVDSECEAMAEPNCPGAEGSVISLLDVATGGIKWSAVVPQGYIRYLKDDGDSGRLVAALEQISVVSVARTFATEVVSFDGMTGVVHSLASFRDEVPTQFVVADATGDGSNELILAMEATDTSTSSGVRVLRGVDGDVIWHFAAHVQDQTPQVAIVPSADGPVAVVGQIHTETVVGLQSRGDLPVVLGLDGATGSELWRNSGPTDTVVPRYFGSYVTPERTGIVGTGMYQDVRILDAMTGEVHHTQPLFGQIYATGVVDVDQDGWNDIVSGGESSGVFAVDGRSALDPTFLWTAPVVGQVHDIHTVELAGSNPVVVVAASLTDGDQRTNAITSEGLNQFVAGVGTSFLMGEVSVLDAHTGALLWRHEFPNELVWNVTIGDIDGDGSPEIIVPTRGVTVLDITTGTERWSFRPMGTAAIFSNAVIGAGHRVLTQFRASDYAAIQTEPRNAIADAAGLYPPTFSMGAGTTTFVALDGTLGAPLWTYVPLAGQGRPGLQWGVASGSNLAWADGNTAAFSFIDKAGVEAEVNATDGSVAATLFSVPYVIVLDVRTGEKLVETTGPGSYQPNSFRVYAVESVDGYALNTALFKFGLVTQSDVRWVDFDFTLGSGTIIDADLGPLGTLPIAGSYATAWWPCMLLGSQPCEGSAVGLAPGMIGKGLPGFPRANIEVASLQAGQPSSVIAAEDDLFLLNDLNVMNGAGYGFGYDMRIPGISVLRLQGPGIET